LPRRIRKILRDWVSGECGIRWRAENGKVPRLPTEKRKDHNPISDGIPQSIQPMSLQSSTEVSVPCGTLDEIEVGARYLVQEFDRERRPSKTSLKCSHKVSVPCARSLPKLLLLPLFCGWKCFILLSEGCKSFDGSFVFSGPGRRQLFDQGPSFEEAAHAELALLL